MAKINKYNATLVDHTMAETKQLIGKEISKFAVGALTSKYGLGIIAIIGCMGIVVAVAMDADKLKQENEEKIRSLESAVENMEKKEKERKEKKEYGKMRKESMFSYNNPFK